MESYELRVSIQLLWGQSLLGPSRQREGLFFHPFLLVDSVRCGCVEGISLCALVFALFWNILVEARLKPKASCRLVF
jgi:hypothetical protein